MAQAKSKTKKKPAAKKPNRTPSPPKPFPSLEARLGEAAKTELWARVMIVRRDEYIEDGDKNQWIPKNVWDLPLSFTNWRLVPMKIVGGGSVSACRNFVTHYNYTKMLDQEVDDQTNADTWAIIFFGPAD